jgi:hypothetical protein
MSGSPVDGGLGDLTDFCPAAEPGWFIWCNAQNTLAFNRLASGWIDGTQVAIHRSGMANYTLDRPHGAGVQMVALPDPAAPLSTLVIEARPATGRDRFNQRAGVSVHLIDQGPASSARSRPTGGSARRRAPRLVRPRDPARFVADAARGDDRGLEPPATATGCA